MPEPAEGEVLIRNAFISVDPSMRARMNDVKSYVPPFQVGEVMSGGAVGQVVASRNERVAEGSWVTHGLGWRELALSDGRGLIPSTGDGARLDGARRARDARPDRLCGAARDRPAASGRDGLRLGCCGRRRLVAGQIAKLKGCRVIGSAGSAEKVAWLEELGFDEAFDYREADTREALREGIDLYFDNVGGATLEVALSACARTAGSSPAARSPSTTPPSARRGRATCSTSSRSGCASRDSS